MRLFFLSVLLLSSIISNSQRIVRRSVLWSPDSTLQLQVNITDKIFYSLYAGNDLLMSSDQIDIVLTNGRQLSGFTHDPQIKNSSVNETIKVPVSYRNTTVINHYNQKDIDFKNSFTIQFRLFNNGMGYRIGLKFKDSVKVKAEHVSFNIDSAAVVWYANMDKRPDVDRYHTSFEAIYQKKTFAELPDTMLTYGPLTLKSKYYLAFTDANLIEYPGMFIGKTETGLQGVFAPYPLKEEMSGGDFPQYVVRGRADYIAKIKGTRMLPWRVVMVAKKAHELPANDIVYSLADPTTLKDVSWVKTAKGTDEWITGINLFNVDFVAGINTATYKYYIDFAKKFGFDQVMLDAGWSDYKDLFKINPDLDMPELVKYAAGNNVRLMLWTLCSTLDRQLDSALIQFKKWGVASIMTDFMDRDDQPTVNFYHRVAKACAENKITVMFHGAFPPKGLNRTWPNVLTHEGVLGSEWNIWSELATPAHNVTIPFTRMLAGPLDYEPGLLLNAQKDQFRAIGKNPMSQGTRSHQLAMFVIYDSPLQIFSGNISQGMKEPAFMELLGSIPSGWDETIIVAGEIGEFIITARRKNKDWFLAGMNNEEGRPVSIPLDFLKDEQYTGTLCIDGINADNYAADYSISNNIYQSGDTLNIKMAKGGGFLVRLIAN